MRENNEASQYLQCTVSSSMKRLKFPNEPFVAGPTIQTVGVDALGDVVVGCHVVKMGQIEAVQHFFYEGECSSLFTPNSSRICKRVAAQVREKFISLKGNRLRKVFCNFFAVCRHCKAECSIRKKLKTTGFSVLQAVRHSINGTKKRS